MRNDIYMVMSYYYGMVVWRVELFIKYSIDLLTFRHKRPMVNNAQ